jgi:hypothetical protein
MPGRTFDQRVVWYRYGDAVKLKVLNNTGKGFLPVVEQTATRVSQGK